MRISNLANSNIKNFSNVQKFGSKEKISIYSKASKLANLNNLRTSYITPFENREYTKEDILKVSSTKQDDVTFQTVKDCNGKTVVEIEKNEKSDEEITAMTGSSGLSVFVQTKNGLVYKMCEGSEFVTDNLKIKLPQVHHFDPSFEGNLYVSMSKNQHSDKVIESVNNFWDRGNIKYFENRKSPYLPQLDYNLFVPAGGKGTRSNSHKIKFDSQYNYDISTPKPSIDLPIKSHDGSKTNMSFIEFSLSPFVSPNIINQKTKRHFIEEDKGRGNAFSFIDALKNNDIPTNKPMFVAYADSLSDIDFQKFLDSYEKNENVLGLLTAFKVNKESVPSVGLFKVEANDKNDLLQITDLEEKTTDENVMKKFVLPDGQFLSNRSFYIISPTALKALKVMAPDLEKAGSIDFMHEIFKLLMDISMGNEPRVEISGENLKKAKEIIGDKKLYVDMLDGHRSDVGNLRKFIVTSSKIANNEFNFSDKITEAFKKNSDKNGCVYAIDTKEQSEKYLAQRNGKISGNIFVDKISDFPY